jgi:hypothetical protein
MMKRLMNAKQDEESKFENASTAIVLLFAFFSSHDDGQSVTPSKSGL